jgi:hypothetical protein
LSGFQTIFNVVGIKPDRVEGNIQHIAFSVNCRYAITGKERVADSLKLIEGAGNIGTIRRERLGMEHAAEHQKKEKGDSVRKKVKAPHDWKNDMV